LAPDSSAFASWDTSNFSAPVAPVSRVPSTFPLQGLSIREHNLHQTPEWLTILDWFQRDRNFIPRLEGLLAKTIRDYVRRGLSLHNPMYRSSVFTLYVEAQKAMGIGPKPFRDGSLHGDCLPDVENRIAVVCQ
jgi:hypothetical protein